MYFSLKFLSVYRTGHFCLSSAYSFYVTGFINPDYILVIAFPLNAFRIKAFPACQRRSVHISRLEKYFCLLHTDNIDCRLYRLAVLRHAGHFCRSGIYTCHNTCLIHVCYQRVGTGPSRGLSYQAFICRKLHLVTCKQIRFFRINARNVDRLGNLHPVIIAYDICRAVLQGYQLALYNIHNFPVAGIELRILGGSANLRLHRLSCEHRKLALFKSKDIYVTCHCAERYLHSHFRLPWFVGLHRSSLTCGNNISIHRLILRYHLQHRIGKLNFCIIPYSHCQ